MGPDIQTSWRTVSETHTESLYCFLLFTATIMELIHPLHTPSLLSPIKTRADPPPGAEVRERLLYSVQGKPKTARTSGQSISCTPL